jgi:uncharacterized protein YecT (DUF1311 family)
MKTYSAWGYQVRMITVFFWITIASSPISSQAAVTDCPKECIDVEGRSQQEQCAAKVLSAAEEELQKYLASTKISEKDYPDIVKGVDRAQQQWLEFRKAACGAVSETWTTGTGRTIATYACEIDLTRRWTHMIWEYFAPGMKGGKGGLPEPKAGGE